jgi:hypothetical protein
LKASSSAPGSGAVYGTGQDQPGIKLIAIGPGEVIVEKGGLIRRDFKDGWNT